MRTGHSTNVIFKREDLEKRNNVFRKGERDYVDFML